MTPRPSNEFGVNFPLADVEETCRALGIGKGDRVLEVGGAGNAFPRANVVCDLTFGSCAQRNGAPGVFRDDVAYVEAPAENLPFSDDEFDFVYCTQVLEHVMDPVRACAEMSRVAKRGFVELPSRFGELTNGNPSHRWVVDREEDVLVFTPRNFLEHPLKNFFYGLYFADEDFKNLSEQTYRNLFNHQILFEGDLACKVLDSTGGAFDYDDPVQAGRAHYSFARNTLQQGCAASYAYPDAQEAVRRLPESVPAKVLLANYQTRLLRPEDALETLRDVSGVVADALRGTIERIQRGEALDPRTLPLPGADPAAQPSMLADRPLVSVVVAGASSADLLTSAESALTQDYEAVEVVVGAATPLGDGWERLRMGDRLVTQEHPGDTPLGALLNRGAVAARGEYVAFLVEGDRHLAHHVDRMVTQLLVGGGVAVHGDRLLLTGEGVVGPDIVPGNPATAAASLSTFVGRRDFLEGVGAFDESSGTGAGLQWLLRVAGTGRLEHLEEATVESRGPLPEGAEVLDQARATARLRPMELLRDLMAACVREQGLRARVSELERRLSDAGDTP